MAHRRAGSRRQQSVDFPRYPPMSQQQQPQSQVPENQTQSQIQNMPQPGLQSQPLVSDYESDYPGYLSANESHPHHPPPSDRTNEELNLSVLRRHNPDITTILCIAPYAVIYEFATSPNPSWVKTSVEGSLFICGLTPDPTFGSDRYAAIILNRHSLDNFEVELREGENTGVEIAGEYVIISLKEGDNPKIYGVFIFHDGPGTSTENTQKHTAELMKTLADHAGASRQAAEAAAAASFMAADPDTQMQRQGDVIGDLFRRAGLGVR